MEQKIKYLPPKYTQRILPPIIKNPFNDNCMINGGNNMSQLLPQTPQISIGEYKATPGPNLNQTISISPYNSTPQPNIMGSINIQPALNEQIPPRIIHLGNIKQLNIGHSIISNSSITEQIDESSITQPLDTPQSFAQSIIAELNKSQVNIENNISPQSFQTKKSLMGKIPGAMPVYKLIRQGEGINPTELQAIVFCAMKVYQEDILPLSNNTATLIKRKIGGDWLVLVYEQRKPVDFNLTCVEGNDFMFFILDTTAFQVCRLR